VPPYKTTNLQSPEEINIIPPPPDFFLITCPKNTMPCFNQTVQLFYFSNALLHIPYGNVPAASSLTAAPPFLTVLNPSGGYARVMSVYTFLRLYLVPCSSSHLFRS